MKMIWLCMWQQPPQSDDPGGVQSSTCTSSLLRIGWFTGITHHFELITAGDRKGQPRQRWVVMEMRTYQGEASGMTCRTGSRTGTPHTRPIPRPSSSINSLQVVFMRPRIYYVGVSKAVGQPILNKLLAHVDDWTPPGSSLWLLPTCTTISSHPPRDLGLEKVDPFCPQQ